jgi:hypothetical protein
MRCARPRASLIAGAYVDGDGGTCPLLAAHRRGGRVSDEAAVATPFAGLWDLYTGTRSGRPRPIEQEERRALEAMLTASVAREQRHRAEAELERARAEQVRERDRERREQAGREAIIRIRHGFGGKGLASSLVTTLTDRDRRAELSERAGWAWVGVHRRYDQHRATLRKALADEHARLARVEREQRPREAALVA